MPEITGICPGCGLALKSTNQDMDGRYNASQSCVALYLKLTVFTLSLQDTDFVHQLVVDTYAAQHSGPDMKPITITFALIGLYLAFERGYTGREVQQAHMALGKKHREWPRFNAPPGKASLTVGDVLQSGKEESYIENIRTWGKSVWYMWQAEHIKVAGLVEMCLKV